MNEAEKFFNDNSHYISDVEMANGKTYYSKDGVIEMMDKYLASQLEKKTKIYECELNTERIKEYRKLLVLYNLHETTIATLFGKGAEWIIKKLKS